ncbi:MAG: C39 family peptidase [Methanobacterium sp.]
MRLRFDYIIIILALLLIIIPLTAYSDILNNNITQNNTKLLNVPNVEQPNNYTSGPTSLQAVLAYYGTNINLDELINSTNTTLENGTLPNNIAQAARQNGFNAQIQQNMTLQDLQQNINNGTPVIIDCQAWRSNTTNLNENWTNDTMNGHYMVVIGIDNQNVYFEDPAILGSRGYITDQEFLDRWHDQYTDPNTGENITNTNLGIIITGEPVNPPPFIPIN